MDGTTGQRSAMSVYGGNSTGSQRAVQPGEPLPRRALDSRHRLSLINSISRSVDRPSPFGRGSHQR